jgi:hypothetical protein
MLSVRAASGRVPALVYLARRNKQGRPKPGYLELVLAAAREWNLPQPYIIGSLQCWSAKQPLGTDLRKIGAFR